MRIEGMVMRDEVAWGSLPAAEQEEIDGAVAMLTEARAQGHARTNCTLGGLLENERKDIDGAEAAYRAAIAADPGHAFAHRNLGTLLLERARQIEKSGGDLAKAADMFDEIVEHYTIAVGTEHPAVKVQKANAARLRAFLLK